MGELQRVEMLSPAFSCSEDYVHSGAFGEELQGMQGGSTHARVTSVGTWTPDVL